MKPEILFLSQENVVEAGVLDMPKVMEQVEKAYTYMGKQQVKNPAKIQLAIPDPVNWNSFFMSMPSYIEPLNIAGFKWAAESHENVKHPGMPLGLDIVMLSDPATVYPKAIMDGTIITAMRTSGVAGMAAKYLARKNSKVATLVGAGVIGRTMVMSIMTALPQLETIYLCDLNVPKAEALAKEFEGKYNVIASGDTKACAEQSDLIVTETTASKPFLKKAWVKSNATVIQMSSWEIDEEIAKSASHLYLDSWEQMSHFKNSLIGHLHDDCGLTKDGVIELQDVVTGQAPGRTSDDELICCCTLGYAAVDITVANWIYENAKEKGIGTKLNLWENPLWV